MASNLMVELQEIMAEGSKGSNITTELARFRSREAADRTLMAWIRTSLSLIGFGFAVGKAHEYLQAANLARSADSIHSMMIFGLSFISLGVLGLVAAVVQYWIILQRIRREQFEYSMAMALPMIVALLLLLIGAFAFYAIIR